MRKIETGLILSATDLSNSIACRHLTGLDMSVALGERKRPFRPDPLRDLLAARGLAHEKAYVDSLKARGLDVLDLGGSTSDPEGATSATLEAMRAGRDVIVQAGLSDGRWFGRPDVLRRIDKPGLWAWSYEAVDTKLAQETRGGTILQLSFYSELLRIAQGREAEHFHVVTPRSGFSGETYRTADYAAYFRSVRARLEATVELGSEAVVAGSYPEPVDHCDICPWLHGCDKKRRADDHLCLIASASRSQRRELVANGFATLESLALRPAIDFKPKHGSREALEKLREQAKVQFESRGLPVPVHRLRPVKEDMGLRLLPEPSPGDVFLDLEGDPFAAEGGREYLFGVVTVGESGHPVYRAWWGLTEAEEKAAFTGVMDFIGDLRAKHPGMHVYHFAKYEQTAFKKLMGRHATRAEVVDALLRGGHFIDLLEVVRQGLLVGVESYSIKKLEPVYGYERAVPMESANFGLRAMERALETGVHDIPSDIKSVVEGYNQDDCISTLRLRDWLEGVRESAIAGGADLPRPVPGEAKASDRETERSRRVEARRAELLAGVPAEKSDRSPEQQARWLLAYMLDWHSREGKAAAWEYIRLRDMPEEDLVDERQAVAGLEFAERLEVVRNVRTGKATGSVIDRYRYPSQEMEMRPDDELKTSDGRKFGELWAVDRAANTIDVKKSGATSEDHPTSIFSNRYISPAVMESAIDRIAVSVVCDGGVIPGPGKQGNVARKLLLATPPHLRSGPFERRIGEDAVPFAVRNVTDMQESVLAIQGPPGAGKTYAGAQMIRELVSQGKKIGVTSNGHKVILNLLAAVVEATNGAPAQVAHLASEDYFTGVDPRIERLENNEAARSALRTGSANVVGGTSWMWAREEFAESVDVLFVDEAAQVSLANVLAAAHAASSIVLLGDPQQLDQPKKGSHPEGVDASALGHILGDHLTMPKDRGIFLPVTWRLAPAIAEFTSELFYEGLLTSKAGLENQSLRFTDRTSSSRPPEPVIPTGSSFAAACDLSGSGLRILEVPHDGNRHFSVEEIDAIAALLSRLTDGSVEWINEKGVGARVTGKDVLVVAPYNAQVIRLAERLTPTGARVGTVDRFQGQEAPIVIYSMATSCPEDAPRGMEFLFSLNRLNVATSRARCLAILVASPRLFEPEGKTPRQMKLANALCRFREVARRLPSPYGSRIVDPVVFRPSSAACAC